MKKIAVIACSMFVALIIADSGLVGKAPTGMTVAQLGKGKAPVGKGKAPPPVVTKG
jgi:hypothetical protein